jgi:hypothetical protein
MNMDYFTYDETGDPRPESTRPRGQKMGIASVIIAEKREAYGDRMFRALCLFGIAFCVTGIVAIMSICTSVALVG